MRGHPGPTKVKHGHIALIASQRCRMRSNSWISPSIHAIDIRSFTASEKLAGPYNLAYSVLTAAVSCLLRLVLRAVMVVSVRGLGVEHLDPLTGVYSEVCTLSTVFSEFQVLQPATLSHIITMWRVNPDRDTITECPESERKVRSWMQRERS